MPCAGLSKAGFWSWATPLAAVCLALLVNVNFRIHSGLPAGIDHSTYFATISMEDRQSSNTSRQTYTMTKRDVNLDNNVWSSVMVASVAPEMASPGAVGSPRVAVTNRYD
jgi:hypothetical protein